MPYLQDADGRLPDPTSRTKIMARLHIRLALGGTTTTLGLSWLILLPLVSWVLATSYVPLLGSFSSPVDLWAITLLIAFLSLTSLLLHVFSHALAARWAGGALPPCTPLYPFGDAAQVWPAAAGPGREILVAAAGPLLNLLLAMAAYLLWNAQLHPYLNVSMPALALFNACVVLANLAPAFPFDGGRVLRAVIWGWFGRLAIALRAAMVLGYLFAVALVLWGITLFVAGARFSFETGLATFIAVLLILLGLRAAPPWIGDDLPRPGGGPRARSFARAFAGALLLLVMLLLAGGLLPTNAGLEAPGVAVPVEPMIVVPPERRFPTTGSLILTSVIQQAPITVAEWVIGQLHPAIRIMPADQIVPRNTTLTEQARQGFQMLERSEMTAAVVGLRLAGYDVPATDRGIAVMSIVPDSPARNVLRPDDLIRGVDRQPIRTATQLLAFLRLQRPDARVQLHVLRNAKALTVTVPLMPPAEPAGPPRLGIVIGSAGIDAALPFPVTIVPQKIVGGPSAGLMFTLAVYDAVTPENLTGGHKIAGTGTIELDGTVGPIGGVEQKVAAAENAGAEYFLAPPENYAAARAVARRIKVVEVATAAQAVEFLRSLPADAGA